ncbi:MAG: hypothetical protein R3F07_08590 [Opitutaceae bacterium]
MNGAKNRLRQFEDVLKAFLDVSRSGRTRRPRFPAIEAGGRRSLVAAGLVRGSTSGASGPLFSRSSLFGAGGSISRGRIRHFSEQDFEAVPMPGFVPIGDTRRLASSRRRSVVPSRSGWRSLFHVLLHR